MPEKSKTAKQKISFEEVMGEKNDDQLKEVLRKRRYYQADAVQVAIHEAVDRGLIGSEDDLVGPEFREEPIKRKFIPEIENEHLRAKIRKSIARGMLIAGILPTIWGYVRLNAGHGGEGMALLAFGITWIGFSARLIRGVSQNAVKILFALVVVSLVYVGRMFLTQPRFVFMDVFIIVVLYFLLFYGLAFITRLNK